MNELHDKSIYDNNFEPEVGQRDLACSNKKSYRCPSFGATQKIFPKEELKNISELCSVFKKVRSRLISEGYSIENLRKQIYEQKTR